MRDSAQKSALFAPSVSAVSVEPTASTWSETARRKFAGRKGLAIPLAGAIARVEDYVRYGDGSTTADKHMVQTWMLPRFGIPELTRCLAELYVCSHEVSIHILMRNVIPHSCSQGEERPFLSRRTHSAWR